MHAPDDVLHSFVEGSSFRGPLTIQERIDRLPNNLGLRNAPDARVPRKLPLRLFVQSNTECHTRVLQLGESITFRRLCPSAFASPHPPPATCTSAARGRRSSTGSTRGGTVGHSSSAWKTPTRRGRRG